MLFLGTGAADVIPNPFCTCPICEDAREHPENGRLRSMFLLDEKTLIDFGPDLAAAAIKAGTELSGVERVFITHTHQDHLCLSNAGLFHMSRTRHDAPLKVYMSEAAYQSVMAMYQPIAGVNLGLDELGALKRGELTLHPLKVGQPYEFEEYTVMAVQTTHRATEFECGVNYLFETKQGKKILYACDTGYYPPETLELLRGSEVDLLVLEATWGSNHGDINLASHLNDEAFVQMLDTLMGYDVIRKDTRVYASHVNHKHDYTHELYQKWFDEHAPIPVIVARDGLEVHWD